MKNNGNEKNHGITIIVLVITIIILLILASISIAILTGENGLFTRAKEAKEKMIEAQEKENLALASYEKEMSDSIDGTINNGTSDKVIEGLYQFNRENEGFLQVNGEVEFSSLDLKPTAFQNTSDGDIWKMETKIEKKLNNTIELNNKFEISFQIYMNNKVARNMGGIVIILYTKNNEELKIDITDHWEVENKFMNSVSIKNVNLYQDQCSTVNASGRYALIGDGQNAYFYFGDEMIASSNYKEGLSVDKIEIYFKKFDSSHSIPPTIIENLYIGEPLYYKSIIGD